MTTNHQSVLNKSVCKQSRKENQAEADLEE